MPDALPDRKHPAHGVEIESDRPTIVFLTVCTKDRTPWLANQAVHQQLQSIWRDAVAWLVGRYIIMPDHIHLFAGLPNVEKVPFDNWVKYWKSQFTKQHRRAGHDWQTDHWDRRLRNEDSYDEKWEYVRNNAVRHGLVQRAEDWPYQGGIFELCW